MRLGLSRLSQFVSFSHGETEAQRGLSDWSKVSKLVLDSSVSSPRAQAPLDCEVRFLLIWGKTWGSATVLNREAQVLRDCLCGRCLRASIMAGVLWWEMLKVLQALLSGEDCLQA